MLSEKCLLCDFNLTKTVKGTLYYFHCPNCRNVGYCYQQCSAEFIYFLMKIGRKQFLMSNSQARYSEGQENLMSSEAAKQVALSVESWDNRLFKRLDLFLVLG